MKWGIFNCHNWGRLLFHRHSGERAIFVFAFAKSDKANLSAAELKVYRKAASIMLELGDDQIETEVEAGRLVEVKDDEQG